ncbi:MAG: S8 family serine peptidase [Solirubrobacteraceae bacterium]
MEPGEDERGREVRARVLTRRALALTVLALLAPAAPAAAAPTGTGRLLVTLAPGAAHQHTRAATAVVAAAGARRAGWSVPAIGLVTLRPAPGASAAGLARRLRADPRVARVQAEHRARIRFEPDDPALSTPETANGTAPGTAVEWWAARSAFPAAWDVTTGLGATVAVIDTGAETTHPELADRVAGTQSFDRDGPATSDPVGHGTHVSSLACGAGNNGIGLAGAGLRCKLLVIRSDFSDSSVAAAIVWATDHGADAINMSFGTDPGVQPNQAVQYAIAYAYSRNVVLAAAAADDAIEDQGYPASLLQPTGTGSDLSAGRGLSVTAADATDQRASFAGRGSQISLAAYGSYGPRGGGGPRGIFGAFTSSTNQLETGSASVPPRPPCRCRATFGDDARYAYVQGTSMSTPMVAATGALMRHLNPALGVADIVRDIKDTARRPPGSGWNADLGWGILDAGAALARARDTDRTAPASKVRIPRRPRSRRVTLRWKGSDVGPPGVARSGVARYELWRSRGGGPYRRVVVTRRTTRTLPVTGGRLYRFYTVATDAAGNREAKPARPDVSVRLKRLA